MIPADITEEERAILDRCAVGAVLDAGRVVVELRAAVEQEQQACKRDLVDVCRLDYPTGGVVEHVVAIVLKSAIDRIEKRAKGGEGGQW